MEWYRAARARYRDEMTRQDVDEAEARDRELGAQPRRAMKGM